MNFSVGGIKGSKYTRMMNSYVCLYVGRSNHVRFECSLVTFARTLFGSNEGQLDAYLAASAKSAPPHMLGPPPLGSSTRFRKTIYWLFVMAFRYNN